MKILYISLYTASLIVLLIVLLGGNLSKPVFDKFSSRTLNTAGIKKENIDSLDSRIDDAFFRMRLIQYQIEKFKSFFSDKKVDESNFKKENNEVFARNIYNPLVSMLNYVYRFIFFSFSIILLLAGMIVHIIYRNMRLRRRVDMLEKAVYG